MVRPIIKQCPNCDGELEPGFLSFGSYLKWSKNKPSGWHGLNGELVAGSNYWMRNRSTMAIKCCQCGLIKHLPDEYPKKSK